MTTKEIQEALTDLIVKAEESIAARDREGYATCLREIKRITLAWEPEDAPESCDTDRSR